MNKTIIASAVLSLLSFGAMADNPSFDNVEIGYTEFDFEDGIDIDIDGFEIKGSKELSDNFYLAGDFTRLSENGIDIDLTTFGVGYKNDFSNTSTFFSEIDYARIDADGGLDEDGYEVTIGIRSMLSQELEVKVAAEYLDIDGGDTTSLIVGGAYNFTKKLAAYADYSYESDLSSYAVGLRYSF